MNKWQTLEKFEEGRNIIKRNTFILYVVESYQVNPPLSVYHNFLPVTIIHIDLVFGWALKWDEMGRNYETGELGQYSNQA